MNKLVKLALPPLQLPVPVVCVRSMLSTSLLRPQTPFSCYLIPFLHRILLRLVHFTRAVQLGDPSKTSCTRGEVDILADQYLAGVT